MDGVPITLSQAQLLALDRQGLRLQGLRDTGRLAPGARIEAPTSILATVAADSFIDIGAFCNLSGGAINNARIGRYCSIASGVVLGPHEHPTDWLTTSRTGHYPQVNGWDRLIAGPDAARVRALTRPFLGSCPVTTLGPDVWIGQGAFVRAGVTIGAGAIIGARATVLRDVPPYAVAVGAPARVVRLRFSEAIVARLLALEWWRFSIYDLFDAPFDRVEDALEVIEARAAAGGLSPFVGREVRAADLADPRALAAALAAAPIAAAS